MSLINDAQNGIKKAVEGFKKAIKKVVNIVKFLLTPVGHVVGILVLVVFLIIVLAVILRTLSHFFASMFDPDYAGLSTDADYEYLVASIGYAGYDSVISEKNWQEYLAYEYSVLMDAAEYLYDGQTKFEENPDANSYQGKYDAGVRNTEAKAQAHMPYLVVQHEYDISEITESAWRAAVIEGQGSARFGFTSPSDVDAAGSYSSVGGQTDCVPPTITYEFKTNPNDENAGSLVPYVSIVKEQFKYHYFTVGGENDAEGHPDNNGGRSKYEENQPFESSGVNGGVLINEKNIGEINLLEKNDELNVGNGYLPNSTYTARKLLNMNTGAAGVGSNIVTNEDSHWPLADIAREQNLYFTDEYASRVYKMPLQVLIDRYLPKASLLTSWYMLKDTDYISGDAISDENTIFKVDELMKDIKGIYNFYCWGSDNVEYEKVDTVTYDTSGAIARNDSGEAIIEEAMKPYATTNEHTFLTFGQVGLETNRYGVFSLYNVGTFPGPSAPQSVTTKNSSEETTVPIVTDLLADDAYFLETLQLKIRYDYDFDYEFDETITKSVMVQDPPYEVDNSEVDRIVITEEQVNHIRSNGGTISVGSPFRAAHAWQRDCPDNLCTKCYNYAKGKIYADNTLKAFENLNNGSYRLVISRGSTVTVTPEPRRVENPPETEVRPRNFEHASGELVIDYHRNDGDLQTVIDREISAYIRKLAINKAEEEMKENPLVSEHEVYAQEAVEHSFANYLYEFPYETESTAEGITAKPLETLEITKDYYATNSDPFYYFKIAGESNIPQLKSDFSGEILEQAKEMGNDPEDGENFKDAVKTKIMGEDGSGIPDPDPERYMSVPNNYQTSGFATGAGEKHVYSEPRFKGITRINEIIVDDYTPTGNPDFKKVSSYPEDYGGDGRKYNALFSIREETVALSMDVPQKRCSAMLVTTAETWSKSAKYEIIIKQNQFVPTTYRYVIPHSWYGFGLRVFNIDEIATFRTNYYSEYFSNPETESQKPNAIKEADVMSMFLKWEEYGESGVDTAYVFIRDLYKLVMFMRKNEDLEGQENATIHPNAYTYLYVPDDVWDFREGITQEAYWTQLLASEMHGADAMSQEELNWMRVKKNVIKWQQLDYADYKECVDNNEAYVYALFPHGNEFTRSWFMEDALSNEYTKFYDGGYKMGHGGADWTSRERMPLILKSGGEGDDIYARIYASELKRRTLKNIWDSANGSNRKSETATSFLSKWENGDSSYGTESAYTAAKTELDKQLKEYSVRSPIVSIATGYVIKSYYNCYGGFAVHVGHVYSEDGGPTIYSTYAHMRRWPEVQVGDFVGPGTIVGYEGTTGNSGGFHLHMGINVNGVKQSPSRYMAPIFSPFYNLARVNELLNEDRYKADNRLLLGTDYLSLIRTVLLPEFDGKTLSTVVKTENDGIYIPSASFIDISGETYIDTAGSYLTLDDNHIIVKVGVNNPEYLSCEVEKVVTDDESEKIIREVDDDGTPYTYKLKKTMYKVINTSKVDMAKVKDLGTVIINNSLTTDNITSAPAKVEWGNNVPYLPLATVSEAVDIGVLTTAKEFQRDTTHDLLEGKETFKRDDSIEDVRAQHDFFDAGSALVKNHLKISGSLLLLLSDAVNPYAVPFYDGPISMDDNRTGGYKFYESNPSPAPNGNYGYAGTLSGDLQKLQIALKAKGFDPDDTMNTDGIFDDATKEVIINTTKQIGSLTGGLMGDGASGMLGEYDNNSVQGWNGYVTYGSYDNAREAGFTATAYASAITGLDYNFLKAVSKQEGGLYPPRESEDFASKMGSENYYFTTPDAMSSIISGDGNLLDFGGFIIEYPDGQPRMIRRAQGMFQLMFTEGRNRLAAKGITDVEQIVALIRSPMTNAILAAEYLRDNQQQVLANQRSLNVSNPYTEIMNFMKSNDSGAKAWKSAAEYAGTTPENLFIYAMSAIMYNKGGGASKTYFDGLKSVTWYPNSHRLGSTGKTGYGLDVVNEMINATGS